ncbi:hypothetical protein HQ308_22210 [Rhodococcus sp. BP-241]|uniref:oligosaccharide flippase family protein n=1 Tax=Rhodococcus sp. BP-241 TaxID=2739441 RepID=UPI001C9A6651|nr:oligosaccharide flippase family protein [Rhodococcus sp. BP-241]MBY6709510.1 hypothetical protein [Rhodococcus sp. BP-241]
MRELMWAKFSASGLEGAECWALLAAGTLIVAVLALKPFESTLMGAGYYVLERRNQLLGAGFRVVLTLIACFHFKSIVAIAFAEAFALMLPPIVSTYAVLRRRLGVVKFSESSTATMRSLLGYSTRSFSVALTGTLILQSGTLIVAGLGNPAAVTYYSSAFRVYSSVRQLIFWSTDPFRPVLSQLWQKDRESAIKTLFGLFFLASASALTGSTVLILAATEISRLWLGNAAVAYGVPITIIVLLMGLSVNMFHVPFIPAMDAAGTPGAYFLLQLCWLAAYVPAGIVLGHHFGIVGVATAMSVSIVLLEPLYIRKAIKVLQLTWRGWLAGALRPVAFLLVPPLCMTAGVYFLVNVSDTRTPYGFVYSVLFLALVCINSVITRRRLPIETLRFAMKQKL